MTDAAPTFSGTWDFLLGRVLVAAQDGTGLLYTLRGAADGQPRLCLWTRPDEAQGQLGPGWTLYQTDVASRLRELPEGMGVLIDANRPGSMDVDPGYAARLKELTGAFPGGTHSEFKLWPLMPAKTRRALIDAAAGYSFVERLWALVYTIDDSPWLGLLVYEIPGGAGLGSEAEESIGEALGAALDASSTLDELGVPAVRMVTSDDLPQSVAEALEGQAPLFSR